MARYFALFAVLLAVFQIGSCIKCYQCTSATNPTACRESFSGSDQLLVDCSSPNVIDFNTHFARSILPSTFKNFIEEAGTFYCAKLVNERNDTVRTCLASNPGYFNHKCDAVTVKGQPGSLNYCSLCDRDGCNGSSTIAASIPLAFLAFVASYIFYKNV